MSGLDVLTTIEALAPYAKTIEAYLPALEKYLPTIEKYWGEIEPIALKVAPLVEALPTGAMKNPGAMSAADIAAIQSWLGNVLGLASSFYPPLAAFTPSISGGVGTILTDLSTKIKSGDLIPDGRGGYVSKEWAADPRHQLNPDGTFKS